MSEILYFAYGSNLDDGQMRVRCPGARERCRATLAGHRLVFGGFSQRWGGAVANIVPAATSQVNGLVYELTAADLLALDGFEGHPHKYERRPTTVSVVGGQEIVACTYVMQPTFFVPGRPPDGYFEAIYGAYRRLGFDHGPLVQAASREAEDTATRSSADRGR
jgi:gamma-glutamylcyclotransferase